MGNLCGLWQHEHVQVAVLGLDGAGKTSLMNQLVCQHNYTRWVSGMAGYNSVKPTGILPPPGGGTKPIETGGSSEYINIEILSHRGKSFIFFDLGGQLKYRAHWKNYIVERVFAIIYVVDSSDADRLDEARDVLHSIVDPLCPLTITPLVIFNHKVDKPGALNNKALQHALDLHNLKRIVNWRVFSSSTQRTKGVPLSALDYLADMHQNQRTELCRELEAEQQATTNQHQTAHPSATSSSTSSGLSGMSSTSSPSSSTSPLVPLSLQKGKEHWPQPAPDAIQMDGSPPDPEWWDSKPIHPHKFNTTTHTTTQPHTTIAKINIPTTQPQLLPPAVSPTLLTDPTTRNLSPSFNTTTTTGNSNNAESERNDDNWIDALVNKASSSNGHPTDTLSVEELVKEVLGNKGARPSTFQQATHDATRL